MALTKAEIVRMVAEAEQQAATAPGPLQRARAAHSRAVDAYRTVRTWPLRHQVAPLMVLGVLWAGGAAAHHIPEASGPVLLTWTAAAGAGWLARRRRHRTPAARRRAFRRTMRTAVAGAGWLILAAVEGAWGWTAALLWIGGYAAAAPWWYRHQIPLPPRPEELPALPSPPPAPALEAVVEPPSPIPQLWAARVAAPGRVLQGSRLTNHTRVGPADTWTIQLNPGVHTTASAITAAPLIASALSLDIDQVTVDRHPGGGMDRAQLLIVDRASNPLARTNHHPGPETVYDLDTGYAAIGIHADETPARWAFFVPRWGLAGGFVNGGIGSGKSTLITNLATIAAYTRFLSVWAADPQGGQSMPAIIRRATWAATEPEEILRQLRAASRAIDIRGKLNGLRGRELHVPTPAEPGILLFLDELHEIFVPGSEAAHLGEKIARKGRKAAVAMIGASQYPGLPTFGNLPALRAAMFAKNIAVLRVSSRNDKDMIPGLKLNPADLPDAPGLGYLIGARTAPFRGWYTPHADAWMAAAPTVELDRVTAAGIGEDYTGRHARLQAARAQMAREIADFDPDILATLIAADPTLAEALRQHPRPRPTAAAAPAAAATEPTRTTSAGTVLRLTIPPAPTLLAPTGTDGTARPAVLDTPAGARIHQLIQAGVRRPKDLAERAGVSKSRVHAVLGELADAGLVTQPRHGEWTPTNPVERTDL